MGNIDWAIDTTESLYEYISKNCTIEIIHKYESFYKDFIVWSKMKDLIISRAKDQIPELVDKYIIQGAKIK